MRLGALDLDSCDIRARDETRDVLRRGAALDAFLEVVCDAFRDQFIGQQTAVGFALETDDVKAVAARHDVRRDRAGRQFEQRGFDIRTVRAVTGLTWSLGSWDFDSAVGASRNQVTNNYMNRITLSGTSSLFGVSSAQQPPIPTSTATTYSLDQFTKNTDAARNTMRVNFPRKSTSELTFADTRASTTLGKLPGGSQNQDPGYSDGMKGLLHGSNGESMDLGSGALKAQIAKRVCDAVLSQAKTFL